MRRYADPVDVQRVNGAPQQFLWRGRLYLVRDVLAHWVETGEWWRSPAMGEGDTREDLAAEREYWRVEAGAGRRAGTGVFDLCFDWARGGWSLARALD